MTARITALSAQIWTFVLLEVCSAVALALSAAMPLSPAAPVHLDVAFAVLLAVAALGTLVCSRRIGELALSAQAAGGIVLTVVLVASAETGAGTLLSGAGFLWIALWVAIFFSLRRLALTLGAEVAGAVVGVALNRHPWHALGAAAAVLAVTGLAAWTIARVVDGLRRQARHDHLTTLLNRYGVEQALASLERRRSGGPTSLVAIDLDGFKAVNDLGGHGEGDRLLAAFAKELAAAVRASDITARIGGDEFLAILSGVGAPEAACWAANLQGDSCASWSFGIAERRADEPFDSWLGRADQLLYARKRSERSERRAFDVALLGYEPGVGYGPGAFSPPEPVSARPEET